MTTRAGLSAITASVFGCQKVPMRCFLAAAGGKSLPIETPDILLPSPRAKSISVRFGAAVTIRSGFKFITALEVFLSLESNK